ncbi:hypothetical protein [Alcanivorax sp. DP30]|uniref:dCTP deaminase domain-containing protein n=1 Tax=Alcanivorax sp. DP30 TaxID=2606217 RepID=UPI001371341C|nr:hypothetical protein [Alcanivorax sp. DP30]MZR64302.1 hypothetical protein [Alcanivorax sp. DP30]
MIIPSSVAINNNFVFSSSGKEIDPASHREGSMDLTVGCVLVVKGDQVETGEELTVIKPQQTAIIVSDECFNLPDGVIAQALMKNRQSQKGLIAFNTGIVDDNYRKPISTMVTNLSRSDIAIVNSEPFLRVVFHKIGGQDFSSLSPGDIDERKWKNNIQFYINERKKEIVRLPKDFFSVSETKEEIKKELKDFSIEKFFLWLGGTIGVTVILLSLLNAFVFSPFVGNRNIQANKQAEMKAEEVGEALQSLNEELEEIRAELLAIKSQKSSEFSGSQ